MKKKNALLLFIVGGVLYVGAELLYRKRSHHTMFIVGGLCVLLIDLVCNLCKPVCRLNLFFKALIGGAIISVVEFVAGLIINVKFGLGVWDYSDKLYNIKGQVCPAFSLLWVIISVPVIFFGRLFNKKFKN